MSEELKTIEDKMKFYGGENNILKRLIEIYENNEEDCDKCFQDCAAYILKKHEQLQQENKELKKALENNSKINVADHKYASEMEDKYLVEHNILTEFEKWLEEEINIIENTYSQINGNYMRMQPVLDTFKKCEDRLQELKGDDK